MLPVFKPGQIALVQPLSPAPGDFCGLSAGDCAVYELEGRVLLHRVVKTVPGGAWFADDSGRIEPHLVPWKKIRGKALNGNPLAGGLCGRLYSKLRRSVSKLFV